MAGGPCLPGMKRLLLQFPKCHVVLAVAFEHVPLEARLLHDTFLEGGDLRTGEFGVEA